MHAIIDDFAWIAIGLVPLALLFAVGVLCILIYEGTKALIRRMQKPAVSPDNSSQAYNLNQSGSQTTAAEIRQALQPASTLPAGHDRQAIFATIARGARRRFQTAKSGVHSHLHIRHRKPANAKP